MEKQPRTLKEALAIIKSQKAEIDFLNGVNQQLRKTIVSMAWCNGVFLERLKKIKSERSIVKFFHRLVRLKNG